MPTVARFSIAPVRSLGLEHPSDIEVTELGVVEDRRFYLTDESNRLVDRIVVGRLVQVAAHTDPEATALRMTFPDGTVIEDEIQLGDPVETHIHGRTGVGHVVIGPWGDALAPIAGRRIVLVRCDRPGGTRAGNPTSIISDGSLRELAANAGVDEVELGEAVETPIHGRTGVGHVVIGPWADALTPIAGRRIVLVRCDRPGGTSAGNPTSIISDGSLRELAANAGVDTVDPRRFRMLIDLEGARAHEEDTWIGGRVAIGDAVLRVTKPDARCAITTQDPDTGERDLDTLRTIIGYRGLREGKHADFGVLADVEQPGRMRLGDEVRVLSMPTADPTVAAPATAG